MADDPVTLGELKRQIETFAASVNTGISGLQGQLRDMDARIQAESRANAETFVRKDVLGPTLADVENRIRDVAGDVTALHTRTDTRFDKLDAQHVAQQNRNRGMVIALISVAIPALISVVSLVLTVLGAGAAT